MAKKKKTEKAPRQMTRRALSAHRRQQRRQRLIFFGGVAIIAAIIVVIIGGWVATEYIPLHRTVITVNGVKINASDYVGYMEIAYLSQKASGQSNTTVAVVASSAVQQIENGELMRQAAEKLGITVTDKEAETALKNAGLPVNNGAIAYVRAYLLQNKLKSDYFGPQVPASDNQVWSNIMLLESNVQAQEIRGQIVASDNFTGLASQYALNYYSQKVNSGDFGWHPQEVLYDQLGSEIPVTYAFGSPVGSLSDPLYDPDAYKQEGYWLNRVLDPPAADSANVDALFVSSEDLANHVRVELENTDNISPIADNYTQYSTSKEKHGHLGLVEKSTMTDAFNNYVFSDNVVLGDWSQPIKDDSLWTQGGSWLVKVVDRQDNKPLSTEDHDYLVNKRLDDWTSKLQQDPSNQINTDGLTDDEQQWAIDRATKFLQKYQG